MVNFGDGLGSSEVTGGVWYTSIPGKLALTSFRGVSMCTIYVFHLDVI